MAHVDLAGDGGGDQGGAAFLEQGDGVLGFGGEGVELVGLDFQMRRDRSLLQNWWLWKAILSELFAGQMSNSRRSALVEDACIRCPQKGEVHEVRILARVERPKPV